MWWPHNGHLARERGCSVGQVSGLCSYYVLSFAHLNYSARLPFRLAASTAATTPTVGWVGYLVQALLLFCTSKSVTESRVQTHSILRHAVHASRLHVRPHVLTLPHGVHRQKVASMARIACAMPNAPK
jgi:hypothetical protein